MTGKSLRRKRFWCAFGAKVQLPKKLGKRQVKRERFLGIQENSGAKRDFVPAECSR